jgi:hypothetical protein
MRRLLCLFGYHRHGRVRETGRRLCSTCKDCKSSLVLDHLRNWVTVEEDRKARRGIAPDRAAPKGVALLRTPRC